MSTLESREWSYIKLIQQQQQPQGMHYSYQSYQLWVTITVYSASWVSTEVVYLVAVWLVHGWCHMKLLPSWHTFCVHNATMYQFAMSLYSDTPKRSFFYELAIFWPGKKRRKDIFLHPLSVVIFATATVLAFVLLRDSRFNFHCYTQREATPTKKSARKCAATSCAKDYKALSLWQTSFAESPNRSMPAGVAQSRHSFVVSTWGR